MHRKSSTEYDVIVSNKKSRTIIANEYILLINLLWHEQLDNGKPLKSFLQLSMKDIESEMKVRTMSMRQIRLAEERLKKNKAKSIERNFFRELGNDI